MSLLDLELRAIRMRIDGSDLERSLEWQHDRCIRDRAALYEEVLDLRQRLARLLEALEATTAARDDARGAARTLAHAYQHDTRPPGPTLALVREWARTNPDDLAAETRG